MRTPNRLPVIALAALAVLCIGGLDRITGPDLGLSLVYLVPVAVAGWYAGVGGAIVLGTLAATSWLTVDLALRGGELGIAIPLWNGFTRLVIYSSQGVMLALLRRDREILRSHAEREAGLARTDPVTGLPNTRAFLEGVKQALGAARTSRAPLSVLYFDLDNFKALNDRLGHAAGDDILAEVARVLRENERRLSARIGGDEFAMLVAGEDLASSRLLAERVAGQIGALGSRYAGLGFGATVGVAWFHEPPETAEELIRIADDAMYAGKVAGKGQVIVREM